MEKMLKNSKYEVLEEIGQGGMGAVYLVWDTVLCKRWAMKVVYIKPMQGNESAEFATLKNLSHPLLPMVVDLVLTDTYIGMIMEYIEGITLKEYLERKKRVTQKQAIQWGIELTQVLTYLHEQRPPIIYGDLKPSNIMIQPNGSLKLIDMGAAMEYHQETMIIRSNYGTYGYAAPEQLQKNGAKIDLRSDIYAFGITMYQMVTGENPGKPPYEIYPIREINPNLSGGLEQVIQRCTKVLPKDRYQNMTACKEDLMRYRQLEKKQIWLVRCAYVIYYAAMAISAILLGIGMEQLYLERWEYGRVQAGIGLLFLLIAVIERHCLWNKKRKQHFMIKQEVNILLTEKKMVGLWSIVFLCMVLGQLCSTLLVEKLSLTMKDIGGRHILLQEEAVLHTADKVIFELPSEDAVQYQVSIADSGWKNLQHNNYALAIGHLPNHQPLEITFRSHDPATNTICMRTILVSS
ncbi:MAG: serine/threonine-protein kinase [Lachnospiraceae bacterium]